MRLSFRLSALATVAIAGLAAATVPAAAALANPGVVAARAPAIAAPLWTARYKPAHWHTEGLATAVSPDGSTVFAIGNGLGPVSKHRSISTGFTVAYNASTGARLWDARYVPAKRQSASLFALAVSPDGSTVFVTGDVYVGGSPGTYHFLTIAYNASTGARLWVDSTGTQGEARSIAVAPDGSAVFVTGYLGDPITVAYNATTGATLWTPGTGAISYGVSVAVAPDGSAVFVTGYGTDTDPETQAYNAATGALLWTAPAAIRPMDLAVSPDGSTVVITGWGKPETGTQAYNAATGATLWTVHTTTYHPFVVAVSPDGPTVLVTGSAKGSKVVDGKKLSTVNFGTQAYNAATGATLWASRHSFRTASPAGSQAESIAVSPDGAEFFVTGSAPGPGADTPGGYGTVAYDTSTGAVLWTARYHGSFSGTASSVAVSPDGTKVFVTGELISLGPPSVPTMETLAYNNS